MEARKEKKVIWKRRRDNMNSILSSSDVVCCVGSVLLEFVWLGLPLDMVVMMMSLSITIQRTGRA